MTQMLAAYIEAHIMVLQTWIKRRTEKGQAPTTADIWDYITARMPELSQQVRGHIFERVTSAEFKKAVEAFVPQYQQHVQEAKQELAQLFS